MTARFNLNTLIIQNFATFKNQTIRFRPGLNVIVGETGSGKSLVLDALQLILGGRADKKVVRRETDCSLIEASFFCDDGEILNYLEREGYPVEGQEIVIKRVIYRNGTTKNYINHLSCTVSFLASFSRKYIDLVGQFENQKLLSESYQLYLLDHFAKQLNDVASYQLLLRDLRQLKKDYKDLVESRALREQRLDYLNFQLQEIEKLGPSSQDEDDLLRKKNLLINYEKDQKLSHFFGEILDGGDNSTGVTGHFRLLNHHFIKNPDLFGPEIAWLVEIEDKLSLLRESLEAKLNVELDPSELEGVLERLDQYQKLKKKFGGTVEGILESQLQFTEERLQLETLELNLGDQEQKIEKMESSLRQRANDLHQKRLQASKKLAMELTKKVRGLNMNGATIKLEIESTDNLTDSGSSRAVFLAETNPGEGYFKIKDIASGGELSRILLALRQILSTHDSISIFLFDEIDTGIGGETAICIGKALDEVARNGQVIAITHLPQIAQFAATLIMVNKSLTAHKNDARTESITKEIVGKQISKEIRAMAQLA